MTAALTHRAVGLLNALSQEAKEQNDASGRYRNGSRLRLLGNLDQPAPENAMSRRSAARFAETFMLLVKGAAPTLVVLLVAVLSGPPWTDVLVDLRHLLALLVP